MTPEEEQELDRLLRELPDYVGHIPTEVISLIRNLLDTNVHNRKMTLAYLRWVAR